MVDKIRDYFLEHVSLADEFNNILADFLEEEATSYTIEPIPEQPFLRPYTDGGGLRHFVFQFGSREFYDNSVAQNIKNLDFYDKFRREIESNNDKGILPDIEGIQSIECMTDGTIDDIENNTAKYIIQMRITYYTDKVRDDNISL